MKKNEFPMNDWSKKRAFGVLLGERANFHIAVFADPRCVWCKRFFDEVSTKLNDIEIFVYLTPLLGPESREISADILMSEDPAKAWRDWMMNEKRPAHHTSEQAQKILDENLDLHAKLGLQVVPEIFLADGSGPYGYMTALELVSKIEQEGGSEAQKGEKLLV